MQASLSPYPISDCQTILPLTSKAKIIPDNLDVLQVVLLGGHPPPLLWRAAGLGKRFLPLLMSWWEDRFIFNALSVILVVGYVSVRSEPLKVVSPLPKPKVGLFQVCDLLPALVQTRLAVEKLLLGARVLHTLVA